MRSTLLILSLWAALGAGSQELDEYVKERQSKNVKGLATSAAIDVLVGDCTIEIEGIVQGIASCEGASSVLLKMLDGKSVSLQCAQWPEWAGVGRTPVRVLVHFDRENEIVAPSYRALAVAVASEVALWETKEAEKKKTVILATKKPPVKPPTIRQQTSRPVTSRGNVTGRGEQVSWAAFKANLDRYFPEYYNAVRHFNPRLTDAQAREIANAILTYSCHYEVDPRLVMALVLAESGFNPNATSRKGAMGLGQLMPGTAKGLGVSNAYDPKQNLAGSVRLLRGHLEKYWNQTGRKDSWDHVVLTLAAYNAGSGAVRKHGGVPPYKETQTYVDKVIRIYKQLCGQQ